MDTKHAANGRIVILSQFIWNKEGIPHKGWSCVKVIDSGHASSKCEMCGNGTVRYIHYLEHDDYSEDIKVGSECSKKLAENYSMASFVETYIKKYPTEKSKWSNKSWKISRSGNPYLKHDEYIITIYKDKFKLGNFKFMTVKKDITTIDCGEGPEREVDEIKFFDKVSYGSVAEVKLAVFEHFYPSDISKMLN